MGPGPWTGQQRPGRRTNHGRKRTGRGVTWRERDKTLSEGEQTLMISREAGEALLIQNKGEETQTTPDAEGTTPRTPDEVGMSLKKTEDTEMKMTTEVSQALNHDQEDILDTSLRMSLTMTDTVRDTENTHAAASARVCLTEMPVQRVDTMCGEIMADSKALSEETAAVSDCGD